MRLIGFEGVLNMISLVMATYNGSKYIEEQLESIIDQTIKVDEIIIVDDCSNDSTVDKCLEFSKKFNYINWNIIKNQKNIGWKKNFKKGIKYANGDFIFLCDQDDIWYKNKIEKTMKIFETYEDAMLVSTNEDILFYNNLKQTKCKKKCIKVPFDKKKFINNPNGCSMCLKNDFFKKIDKYWDDNVPHDLTLWQFSIVMNSCYFLDESTLIHRMSGENVTGKKAKNKDVRKKFVDESLILLLNIIKYNKVNNALNEKQINIINKTIKAFNNRMDVLKNRNIISFLKSIIFYRYIYKTKKMIIGDLFFSFGYKR